MKTELSALLDGETGTEGVDALVRKMARDGELRRSWDEYHLVGSALRAESHLELDLTARVMAEVRKAPVAFAPPRRAGSPLRPLMALAASVSGVAVVAWLAFATAPESVPPPSAGIDASSRPAAAIQTVSAARGMEEYLVAHQTQASSLHLQGGSRHIRTVSATGRVANGK